MVWASATEQIGSTPSRPRRRLTTARACSRSRVVLRGTSWSPGPGRRMGLALEEGDQLVAFFDVVPDHPQVEVGPDAGVVADAGLATRTFRHFAMPQVVDDVGGGHGYRHRSSTMRVSRL